MDNWASNIGIGGGAGLLGMVLGWFGLKSRINDLKESVRYADTCMAIHKAVDVRLQNIEKMQAETRSDIKKLLARG